jgi:hypothetical protein
MPAKGVAREVLLAKWTPGNTSIVLPTDNCLFQLFPLITLPSKRPQFGRTGVYLIRRQTGQELSEAGQSLLEPGDFQEVFIHSLLPYGFEGVRLVPHRAYFLLTRSIISKQDCPHHYDHYIPLLTCSKFHKPEPIFLAQAHDAPLVRASFGTLCVPRKRASRNSGSSRSHWWHSIVVHMMVPDTHRKCNLPASGPL